MHIQNWEKDYNVLDTSEHSVLRLEWSLHTHTKRKLQRNDKASLLWNVRDMSDIRDMRYINSIQKLSTYRLSGVTCTTSH